jgi:methyl-accepting chemotaxis protein
LNSARLPATELVGDLALRILQVREEGFKVLTFTEAGLNPAHINKFVAELQAHISATRALLNEQSQAAIWHEDERRAFVVIAQRFDSFSRAVLDATDIRDTGIASAAAFLSTADEHYAQLSESMQALIKSQRQLSGAAALESSEAVTLAKVQLLAVSVLGLILTAGVALIQARSMQRRLVQASDWAGRIAQGDLRLTATDPAMEESRDKSAQLLVSLGKAGAGLTRLVDSIRLSSESVAQAAEQIAMGNDELARRTETAAATLQQTHASTSQIRDTVVGNAQRAGAAGSLAAAAAEVGQTCFSAAEQAKDAMQMLSKQTGRITDLISGIESLASQSHLLSLNAAVEAARAGTAGKGFSVVAGEVRTLAQRSHSLAAEMRAVIGESVVAIKDGAANVDQMHGHVSRILEHSRDLARDVKSISHATSDQADQVRSLNDALAGLDTDTQGNAALVEEASASAQLLREQAQQLQQLVATFQLRSA